MWEWLKHVADRVDVAHVTQGPMDADVLDATLTRVLHSRPSATLAALAEDGNLVAVPRAAELARHPVVPVPAVQAGMLGLIVPADRTLALGLWDLCQRKGIARGVVRLLVAPERWVRIMLVDARLRYGVRLCVMDPQPEDDENSSHDGAGENMLIGSTDALRPRTAAIRINLDGVITEVDDRASRMLGWAPEAMIQQRPLAFMHPDDHDRAIADWLDVTSNQQTIRPRLRYRLSSGDWLWVEMEFSYHSNEGLEPAFITAQLNDISDEMAAHEALDQREKLFRRLTESLPMGLFLVHTDGTVGYGNSRLPTILGIPSAANLDEQLATVMDADREVLSGSFRAVLDDGLDLELEVGVRLPDPGRRTFGDERRCRFTLTALSDQEGLPGAIVTVSDVTEAARMREELQIKASFDHLTGCHNRASTMAALEQALASANLALAVVFVDLDGFKPINDKFGHAVGDELLQAAATSLNLLPRAGDLVGRIGGDEFLLVFHGIGSSAEAIGVGERVSAALHRRVVVSSGTVELRASVGVALSAPGLSADALVALADAAMYESKHLGNGTPVLSEEPARPDQTRV